MITNGYSERGKSPSKGGQHRVNKQLETEFDQYKEQEPLCRFYACKKVAAKFVFCIYLLIN